MEFTLINSDSDLLPIVQVLNVSHGTVAKQFSFTSVNNPKNNAFIDEETLKLQLESDIQLFGLLVNSQYIGCVAIEKSKRDADTFYIEKVSIIPEYRNQGYGKKLMNFATLKIMELKGKRVSISLIDSHRTLKMW